MSRLALQGASGSGKTYSALLLAYGLCGAYEKVVIIETSYKAANHYSYLGRFCTLTLSPPYTPERFIDAIELCDRSGIEVIIIDTLSAEWVGSGGMKERISETGKESLIWHQSLMDTIERCKCHLIATLQCHEQYQISRRGNRQEVVKIGLAPMQKSDIHYHFHTVLSLDHLHRAECLKDRTSFFEEHSGMVITEEIAALYAKWCGSAPAISQDLHRKINACTSVKQLLRLMEVSDTDDSAILQAFRLRRIELEQSLSENPIFSLYQNSQNGTYNHRA